MSVVRNAMPGTRCRMVSTSSMVRQTELTFLTRAGTEIGVASTKAFTTQLTALFLLVLALALCLFLSCCHHA